VDTLYVGATILSVFGKHVRDRPVSWDVAPCNKVKGRRKVSPLSSGSKSKSSK
jgi:hypothetical protein